jgi:hypothetical protein
MKTISEYSLKMPGHSICYLINNDPSELEDKEIKEIDNYMKQYYQEAKEVKGYVIFSPGEEESYFCRSPEFGLPGMVIDCTLLIVQ